MSTPTWHTSFATSIGTSHKKQMTACQDAGLCRFITLKDGEKVLLAVASDGAGSAPKSDIGSAIVVSLFMSEFEKALNSFGGLSKIDKNFILQWLEQVRCEIAIQAEESDSSLKNYACTVLGAVVASNEAVFFQIGDGAIIVSKDTSHDYSPIFWPQHGEYANQTNFITQENFSQTLEFAYIKEQFEKVAIFTDGIERLILNFSTASVHPPALSPIFDWLQAKDPIESDSFCPALLAYLESDFINNRTDDDKTLIVAVRTSPT